MTSSGRAGHPGGTHVSPFGSFMGQDQANLERDRRALEIFAQACGLADADRAALIEQLCGADPAVRIRVEAMLAADGSAASVVGSDAEVDGFVARQIREIT